MEFSVFTYQESNVCFVIEIFIEIVGLWENLNNKFVWKDLSMAWYNIESKKQNKKNKITLLAINRAKLMNSLKNFNYFFVHFRLETSLTCRKFLFMYDLFYIYLFLCLYGFRYSRLLQKQGRTKFGLMPKCFYFQNIKLIRFELINFSAS